jgi:light-harvesting protein B-800-850 beta chain
LQFDARPWRLPAGTTGRGCKSLTEGKSMEIDPNKVWPSGLTLPEAEELHNHILEGTKIFGAISLFAHFLAFAFTPWLH